MCIHVCVNAVYMHCMSISVHSTPMLYMFTCLLFGCCFANHGYHARLCACTSAAPAIDIVQTPDPKQRGKHTQQPCVDTIVIIDTTNKLSLCRSEYDRIA